MTAIVTEIERGKLGKEILSLGGRKHGFRI